MEHDGSLMADDKKHPHVFQRGAFFTSGKADKTARPPKTFNIINDSDDDDDGSGGGKQATLSNDPVRSAIKHGKELKQEEQKKDAYEKYIEEMEKTHDEQLAASQEEQHKRYMEEHFGTEFDYDAENLEAALDNEDKAYLDELRATESTAVAHGIHPHIHEQLHYAKITGSITATAATHGAKHATAREDSAPMHVPHATQHFSPHAPTEHLHAHHNPHGPAHWHAHLKHNTRKSNQQAHNQKQTDRKIKAALSSETTRLFSKKPTKTNTTPSPAPKTSVTQNPYAGFNRKPTQEESTSAVANFIRHTWGRR